MPGADAAAFTEATRGVLARFTEVAHLPELPGRGAPADMVGRALALLPELGADLQPAGWRLTDAPGIDHRRARSLLAQDLDVLEEQAQGFDRVLKVQVAGPWTLAATVEKRRGDRVLSDHGLRRELAQALGEGVATHVADVRRRVPGAELWVQVDEPALPSVLAGRVPTASGFGRHRTVHPPEASAALAGVLGAARGAGATPLVHCCAAEPPLALLAESGAAGVSVDLDALALAAYDPLAERFDAGDLVLLGALPGVAPATAPEDSAVLSRVLRLLEMLGLDPAEVRDPLVLTPGCGLGGADQAWTRRVLDQLPRVARQLDERG